jgi:hypothetical protein
MRGRCDFCGREFTEADYMQVIKIELAPTQFQRNLTLENLFMCFTCLDLLQENNAANCRNFRVDES